MARPNQPVAHNGDIDQGFYAQMLAYVSRRVPKREDAEEITQEVFARLAKNISSIEQERMAPWMFVTAKNAITDFYRKEGRSETREFEENIASEEYFIEDEKSEIPLCLLSMLPRLSEEEAELLYQIDFEGNSQQATAEKLSIPYSTLKSKVQRSREKLKKELFACCKITLDSKGHPIDCSREDKEDS